MVRRVRIDRLSQPLDGALIIPLHRQQATNTRQRLRVNRVMLDSPLVTGNGLGGFSQALQAQTEMCVTIGNIGC